MTRIAAALALLLAAGAARAQAPAQPAGYEGAGEAPIAGGDRVRARERALDEAFRQVIDHALARQLDAAALAERSSVIKLSIHPKARTYVLHYAVVEEGDQSGIFRVRINADVALYALMQDVKAGGASAKGGAAAPAKVLVCLVERAGTTWVPSPLSRRLVESVTARGVDAVLADGDCAPAGEEPEPAGAKVAAQAKANKGRGAIAGAARARATGPIRGTSQLSAHAEVRIAVVDAEGRASGEARGERDGWGDGEAAAALAATQAALAEATAKLAPIAERAFPSPSSGGVSVLLSGAERYADLQALLRALATIAGVTAVEPRRFSPEGIEIHVAGTPVAPALVTALGRVPDGARFIAASRDDHTMNVRPVPPPPPPPPSDLPQPPPAPPLPTLPTLPR